MRWIVIAIIACIVPYTWITLRHRKPGPAYLPYADNKARAEVARLLDAGFRRFDLPVERPADTPSDSPPEPAPAATLPGGLPPLLSEALIDKPLVPSAIVAVHAATQVRHDEPYPIRFACMQPNDHEQISRAFVFVRDQEITLVPACETLDGELQSRSRETVGEIVIPPRTLEPGRYRLTLVGAQESRRWPLDVQ